MRRLAQNPFLRESLLLLAIFAVLALAHAPLLGLPYFWDEAGYYIPYAHDFFLTGSVFPTSTIPNPHPPLPVVYLALWWKLFGFTPVVSRLAMLLVAAFGLLQFYRLSVRVSNTQVATAATILVALYPVIFAQSSLAHADLVAFALSLWGLRLYLEERFALCAIALSLAVLAKETAILFPLSLALGHLIQSNRDRRVQFRKIALVLTPLLPLIAWFLWHYRETGYLFGDPEFYRYNVQTTTMPVRVAMALAQRLWQVVGYMNLWVLTLIALGAMILPPIEFKGKQRPRIAVSTQYLFLLLIASYVAFHSLVGGAVLARYLLPVMPLVILIWISTIWRRVKEWMWITAFIGAVFIIGWFINPPQRFAPEDNLNYSHFVGLHQQAAQYLQEHFPHAMVLTAWPATDELTHPYLGYVQQPLRVVRVEDFSAEQIMLARSYPGYDVAYVFSTKYQPPRMIVHWALWERWNREYFGAHMDLPPAAAARLLGGTVVMQAEENGQWVAIIQFPGPHLAAAPQVSGAPAAPPHETPR